ncbi:MAG: methyltransferase domain-containing protein [Saprospiraceae bacterium]|jgi:16S rRNA (cytosine967-C5)-methyltransferase|nr:methyltransferase domain-containing protein [Saprospiraceae bacterium]
MKIHRTLVEAIAHGLSEIFKEGWYADKVIERLLKIDHRWGSRDRAFIAENTYDIVRNWRLLHTLEGRKWVNDQSPKFSNYELIRLVGVNLLHKNNLSPIFNFELPEWPEFEGLSGKTIAERTEELKADRRTIQSVPDWMDELAAAELGDKWDSELGALNQQAAVVLRANRLKTNKSELKKMLLLEGWESKETPIAPDALVLDKRGNIFHNPVFINGFFEVQDAGSQCIAPFLKPEPGMRVVDACAGAGGKTLHLAALMENKGSIIALDTEAPKLEELRKRARRNGAHIIQARHIESSKTIKRLHGTADRLLLDVPCSGLGTLRRNPDAKWKISPQFLDNVRLTQADILQRYSKILKPGGVMVYATCSVLPSENEQQVERFLTANPNFKLEEQRTISPANDGFDGFFMARLKLD